jgi:hypothetical protein
MRREAAPMKRMNMNSRSFKKFQEVSSKVNGMCGLSLPRRSQAAVARDPEQVTDSIWLHALPTSRRAPMKPATPSGARPSECIIVIIIATGFPLVRFQGVCTCTSPGRSIEVLKKPWLGTTQQTFYSLFQNVALFPLEVILSVTGLDGNAEAAGSVGFEC